MTPFLVVILLLGFVFIATERIHHVNRAAVAMFVGVLCWLLYLGYGASYVRTQHLYEYSLFLHGAENSLGTIKEFIAKSVFMKYITDACELVLYILATMTIVEILNSNGCFDFLKPLLRTRKSQKMVWILAGVTFLVSANIDNLTTTCLMLTVMHSVVANPRQRMVLGTIVVLSANAGGAFTVIGDVTSLMLWIKGAVTPTAYSGMMVIPIIVAMSIPIYMVSKMLPDRLALVESIQRFSGVSDGWWYRAQRVIMGIVGIGGLWFIPTFHRITHLSPFVGALCVLALLWIVNELVNRTFLRAEKMVPKLFPQSLEYANIQTMLFLIGVFLAVGAINETEASNAIWGFVDKYVGNSYILGALMGLLSSVLDSTVVVISNLFFVPIESGQNVEYLNYMQNGSFWPFLSFCTAMGSSLFVLGSLAGFALMKMENVSIGWYIRFISGKVLLGWLVGGVIFYLIAEYC